MRTALTAGAAAAAALALPGPAGAAETRAEAAAARPVVQSLACVRTCLSRGRVKQGSTLRVRGVRLRRVTEVVFLGGAGAADDASVKVRPRGDRRFSVRVPAGARSGPLRLRSGRRPPSRPTRPLAIVPPPPPPPPAPTRELSPVLGPRDPDGPRIETALSRTAVYVAGPTVVLGYRINDEGPAPVAVTVDLVRLSDGIVARTWTAAVAPGTINQIAFDGLLDGAIQPEGRYGFRVSAEDASGSTARSAASDAELRDAFTFLHHIFPIRGAHTFGGEGSRFGVPRSGHTHQGHDVFASCGTKLVAARGGKVKAAKYHSSAGYYVVIDGARTGVDYVYMHLTGPSLVAEGRTVATGQQIGTVGASGNAAGCHLHYEMWSAPGWYTGGAPFDPLPSLLAWDAKS